MRQPRNSQETGKPGNAEEELRKSLEQEQGTARRQELLKALWRLSQQSEQVASTVQANNDSAAPDTRRKRSAIESREIERLAVSC
jgi:hypothetical protein